ncbi:MAG: hypothetical protein LUQ13_03515 [Methanomicrobiales archaeon]|nr:hypothetical protein [Methanomicrobiales archaeon]
MMRAQSVFLGVLLLILVLLSAGCLKESQLAVTGITVAPKTVTAATVVLNVTTSAENVNGFGNGLSRLVLQAFDTGTGLLAYESTQEIGVIARREAVRVHSEISLPHQGSYRLIATVFDGNERKAQGEITVSSLERLPTDDARTAVAITGMDFIVRGVTEGRAAIEADVFFTNQGTDPSPPFTVEIKAREKDARLVADRQWTMLGSIRSGSTVMQNVTITVPDQYNYEVEAILWRDDVIIQQGTGNVFLAPSAKIAAGEEFVTRTIETGKFVSAEQRTPPSSESAGIPRQPGFTLPGALASLGAVLYMWRRNHA